MSKFLISFVFTMLLLCLSVRADDVYHVVLQTEKGTIEMDLDSKHAPITTQNFLKYLNDKAYDAGTFFRTVKKSNQPSDKIKIEVIQAVTNETAKEYPAIPLETTKITGLHHLNGTISMARAGPDTATASFFICINDQPELDFGNKRNPDGQGFAAFGHVTKGMAVVRKIQMAPSVDQKLAPAIFIKKAFQK